MASFLLLDGNGCGGPSFVTSTNLNAPIAKNHHSRIATCIDQPVTKQHIGYDDIFGAQDMSSLLHDNMMLSKIVDEADNGVCDIAMNNNGLALSMTYHPTSGYVGKDKCTYEMCIVDDDAESTKECSELTIAIDVEDCSAAAANEEDEVVGEEYDATVGYEQVRCDILYDVNI